jgi:hypothetical protein
VHVFSVSVSSWVLSKPLVARMKVSLANGKRDTQ